MLLVALQYDRIPWWWDSHTFAGYNDDYLGDSNHGDPSCFCRISLIVAGRRLWWSCVWLAVHHKTRRGTKPSWLVVGWVNVSNRVMDDVSKSRTTIKIQVTVVFPPEKKKAFVPLLLRTSHNIRQVARIAQNNIQTDSVTTEKEKRQSKPTNQRVFVFSKRKEGERRFRYCFFVSFGR